MAKSDDWFRNDRWSAAEERAFFSRLRRQVGHIRKGQIARVKAALLEATRDPRRIRAAIALLKRILHLWPIESELALCRWQLARCHLLLEDVDAALDQFELALAQERKLPRYLTGAWADFAQLVVSRKLREHYGDVRRLLAEREKFFIFPADRFVAHACLSMIAWENGYKAIARDEAEKALAEVERPHENKGVVVGHEVLVEQLRRIAR
ncbi:MAG: hypothetical protein JO332_13805 [Planctomycetaceae bacterium]|nr:hypothetical protein [Planctomycetaceae bacterium]